MSEAFLTDKDVAELFKISDEQVRARCASKQWPHIKLGRYYRFSQEHVAAIAHLHEVTPPEPEAEQVPANPWGQKTRAS